MKYRNGICALTWCQFWGSLDLGLMQQLMQDHFYVNYKETMVKLNVRANSLKI